MIVTTRVATIAFLAAGEKSVGVVLAALVVPTRKRPGRVYAPRLSRQEFKVIKNKAKEMGRNMHVALGSILAEHEHGLARWKRDRLKAVASTIEAFDPDSAAEIRWLIRN